MRERERELSISQLEITRNNLFSISRSIPSQDRSIKTFVFRCYVRLLYTIYNADIRVFCRKEDITSEEERQKVI